MSQQSFSAGVKVELAKKLAPDKEGMRAELCALLNTGAKIRKAPWSISFQSEQEAIVKKVFTLVEKLYRIKMTISVKSENSTQYIAVLTESAQVYQILEDLGLLADDQYEKRIPFEWITKGSSMQAYIRGAFIGGGSVTNPQKNYHVELINSSQEHQVQLQEMLQYFELDMHMIVRSRQHQSVYVLYLKEGEQIVDLLNVMQAYTALMDLENIRIEKEMRNQINRSVNCEAANLQKVVQASLKQVEDIQYLIQRVGWEGLSVPLAQMARARLDHPDESLQELGKFLDPPVGRSGVNHRLRKLSEMAEKLRQENNE